MSAQHADGADAPEGACEHVAAAHGSLATSGGTTTCGEHMRRRSVFLVIAIAITLSCSHAPQSANRERTDEEAAVLLAVERFFETMTFKDAAGARAVLDPEGSFVSVRWNDDGERVVRRSSIRDYLERLEAEKETHLPVRAGDLRAGGDDPGAITLEHRSKFIVPRATPSSTIALSKPFWGIVSAAVADCRGCDRLDRRTVDMADAGAANPDEKHRHNGRPNRRMEPPRH